MAAEDLYLKLDSDTWVEGDYDDTNGITGTIYTDRALSSAKNLTGFTLKFKLFKRWHRVSRIDQDATIVTAGSGTWKWLPVEGDIPISGVYNAEIEITDGSGIKKSTKNDVEFFIKGYT
ncbi:upper tail fiber [Nitrososphaeria virus YSH_462411]|uniref:Upper tail fiber n=1 Tax=Nitrososphaeria virus YSH_462411 TaxID=3071321 RepID=A0A976YF23_9CAUD|nr:upper tail fiber [Yangshan Harbor Nitrososphaeria virus]UVF62289.1 upper tail fiber [Nitrososphaeria virus YSH_462411]